MSLKQKNYSKIVYLFVLQLVKFSRLLLVIISVVLFFIFLVNNSILYKYIYKYTVVLILIFLLYSGFVTLTKSQQYGKYTSAIQRFWKRTYYIFWALEYFLFFLLVYLLLIHYVESNFFLDLRAINILNFDTFSNFLFYTILLNSIILISYLTIFFFKNNNNSAVNISLTLLLILLFIVIFYEFSKFFYALNFIADFDINAKLVNLTTFSHFSFFDTETVLKTRTYNYYLNFFLLLKFWHIVFIVLFFVYFIRNFIHFNVLNVDLFAANIQNYIYLFIFNLISLSFFLKNYLVFLYSFSYYWFFLNLNFSNFFYFIFQEILTLCSLNVM